MLPRRHEGDALRAWWDRLRRRLPINQPSDHPFWDVVPTGMDLRGFPTTECLCGGQMFYALVWFDQERAVGGYILDGLCANCRALVTLPTPIDEVI